MAWGISERSSNVRRCLAYLDRGCSILKELICFVASHWIYHWIYHWIHDEFFYDFAETQQWQTWSHKVMSFLPPHWRSSSEDIFQDMRFDWLLRYFRLKAEEAKAAEEAQARAATCCRDNTRDTEMAEEHACLETAARLAAASFREEAETVKEVCIQAWSWSHPIRYTDDFWGSIRTALRRDEVEGDIIKTWTNGEMTMDAFSNHAGDELKDLFPISVRVQAKASELEAVSDRVRKGVTVGGNIKIKEFIAAGSESAVFKCCHVATGELCAVKVYDMEKHRGNPRRVCDIQDEMSTMVQLNSDCVVQVQEHYVTKRNFEVVGDGEDDQASLCFLVMEFAKLGDLTSVINSRRDRLKEKEVVHILHQLLTGLHKLRTAGVVHRALKTDNILVFGEDTLKDGTSLYRVKIADYGFSPVWQENKQHTVAPEMHKLELCDMDATAFAYTKAVDLWSLGHTTFAMLCGELSFGGAYGEGVSKKWHASMTDMHMGKSFADQVVLSSEAKDFIDKLLVRKFSDRMTVQEAAQHQFLNMANWPDLPRLSGWTDIDVLDPNCSETYCSDHRVVVQCAMVQNKDLEDCYIGGREQLPKMYDNAAFVTECPEKQFLEIGKKYKITIVSKKDKHGKFEWVTAASFISQGDELCWGHRQEVKAGEQTPPSVVGKFETDLLKSKAGTKELQCVELQVPQHLDNCILGPAFMCDKSKQKAINMRHNFPALASVVAIVRKNNDRINFPGASDVIYKGDLILLPHSSAGEDATCVWPLDLISVKKFLQESEFNILCEQSAATGACRPDVEDASAAIGHTRSSLSSGSDHGTPKTPLGKSPKFGPDFGLTISPQRVMVEDVASRTLPQCLEEHGLALRKASHQPGRSSRRTQHNKRDFGNLVSAEGQFIVSQTSLTSIREDEDAYIELPIRKYMSEFQTGDCQFQGSFLVVYKCTAKSNGGAFAMARLSKKGHRQPTGLKRDRDVLSSMSHPNVVPLYWFFELDADWVLIMGFCDLGTLRQYIDTNGEPGLTEEETQALCNNILDGLDHLHGNSILHRDICPANIGICGPMPSVTAKIIDFGFAKCGRNGIVVGSDGYRAPEITLEKRRFGAFRKAAKHFDPTVDLYSFGVLLFVMLVGNEAKSSKGCVWTHEEFRDMLEDSEQSLWHCDIFQETGIFGLSQLPEMEDSGAIDTIAALTETDAKCRTQTAKEAQDLRFFKMREDVSKD